MQVHPFFMPAPGGQRFCVYHRPQGEQRRGRVLYLHPFAEEMNKSRRMAALQARALAAQGYAVLQVDMLGCGDSSGDFGDARWDDWVADGVRASRWLRQQSDAPAPDTRLWLWGLRSGCLLAQQVARHLEEDCNFLFWQPPSAGKTLLQQFLRLQLAADLLSGAARNAMGLLQQRLKNGQSVEVAGYTLSADVAQALENAVLCPPAGTVDGQRVEWFALSSQAYPRLDHLPEDVRAQWCQPAVRLVRHALQGPAFWQSSCTEEAPALLQATTAALCQSLCTAPSCATLG